MSYTYTATERYQSYKVAEDYERQRYSSALGRYRKWREARSVSATIEELPPGIVVADCPCGTGRWWSTLFQRADEIIAMDISTGMLQYARERQATAALPVEVAFADAEDLPLEDESVDYVFAHALMKHLPIPVQFSVLGEFSRVSRQGVVASFGVFSPMSYMYWKRKRNVESYPVLPEQLESMASSAGLTIRSRRRCTTPLGLEFTVLFEKTK